jgi:DNA invertase Pin-like site-specific DNA recombinase
MTSPRTRTRRTATAAPGTVVAYTRVSTSDQAENGAGLAAQRATVEAECARRGWTLVHVYEDAGASGKSLDGRPQLAEALRAVESGQAAILLVAKLDRLSRSVQDAAGLLQRAQRRGWTLVAADIGLDMSTPTGEAMANVLATFGQLERRMIGQRTREGLAVKKAQGVRLGRPSVLPPDVVARIVREHRAGESWSAIARGLQADGVPTAHGGARWYPNTVRKIAMGQDAAQLAR